MPHRTMREKIEAVARIAHAGNLAVSEGFGDFSHKDWDYAPEWVKASVRRAVIACLRDPTISAAELHEHWRREYTRRGWTHGSVLDFHRKQHPAMVDFAELPLDQRIRDFLFIAVVRKAFVAVSQAA